MIDASRHSILPARERPAVVAMLVSVLLAALKLAGHVVTGSTALLAAAVDSASDALVSGLNAWTVRVAGAPPDAGHPFGHGKAEHLSGLFQAAMLAVGAGFVLVTPFREDVVNEHLRHPWVGVLIAVVAILVPVFLATFLKRAGRKAHSPALEADAAHYASDYLVNGGVVAAFLADRFLGWRLADPVIAAVIAAAILRLGFVVGVGAIAGLMDSGLARDELQKIDGVIRGHPEIRGYHDLMTRRSGPHRFVQLHVEIDAERSFRDAHRVVESLRHALESALPHAVVTIHADPWPLLPEDDDPAPAVDIAAAKS